MPEARTVPAGAGNNSAAPAGADNVAPESVAPRYPGGEDERSVCRATEGSQGVNGGRLLSTADLVTLAPGFVNTAACSSEICFIDGDAGILRYRGYPIEQLAQRSTFIEVSYLLIYGELPTQAQLDDFASQITPHTLLPAD